MCFPKLFISLRRNFGELLSTCLGMFLKGKGLGGGPKELYHMVMGHGCSILELRLVYLRCADKMKTFDLIRLSTETVFRIVHFSI